MKRHESLAPLSREHHGALILARLLQKGAPAYKGLPADPAGKARYALQFYENELTQHFIYEEKMVPVLKDINPKLDDMLREMSEEHVILRELFSQLNNPKDLSAQLDKLGKALEKHVRKEEREIFPLIQDSCDPHLLSKISTLFHEQ
ncbi:hemerythrin domain-containing protein [Daejeonella lutea]|uniref:Hemerythrin HHE cation binding domain-containing protein n=1 Tax=Daejeonella lutea TaxID=572036 RepID=A0A1T5A4Z8_9SPHI|nr:hemerythrin domain-containing protein [Daejeonella lutea]SKB29909.1 Hemerythrin HHE cation binding domain-containing protein [Daejeonella lutea]